MNTSILTKWAAFFAAVTVMFVSVPSLVAGPSAHHKMNNSHNRTASIKSSNKNITKGSNVRVKLNKSPGSVVNVDARQTVVNNNVNHVTQLAPNINTLAAQSPSRSDPCVNGVCRPVPQLEPERARPVFVECSKPAPILIVREGGPRPALVPMVRESAPRPTPMPMPTARAHYSPPVQAPRQQFVQEYCPDGSPRPIIGWRNNRTGQVTHTAYSTGNSGVGYRQPSSYRGQQGHSGGGYYQPSGRPSAYVDNSGSRYGGFHDLPRTPKMYMGRHAYRSPDYYNRGGYSPPIGQGGIRYPGVHYAGDPGGYYPGVQYASGPDYRSYHPSVVNGGGGGFNAGASSVQQRNNSYVANALANIGR